MNVLNVGAGENTMPTLTPADRRRRTLFNRVRRVFINSLVDIEMDTARKILTLLEMGMAVAVASASSYFIATPPPVWQGVALKLPGWAWMILIIVGLFWQSADLIFPKRYSCECRQRDGAFWLFVVITMLSGPTWIKLPVFSVIVMVTAMLQGVLAARLVNQCPPKFLEPFFVPPPR